MTESTPLGGIRVADFSRVLAGPLATMTLADLGADVVKVERPGSGDDTRRWGPPWTAHSSSYFECTNRSKRSITLDLRTSEDRDVALRLAADADVLVENFLTGTMERLGLGYERLAEVNPRLVYCSITGFGSRGGADLPGYDFVVQAAGGLMSITGEDDGHPTKAGVALVDVLTGKDAVVGILAALHERGRSGRGQHIEVNLLSSLLGSLANQGAGQLSTGSSPGRMGNRHPSIAPYETLECADGLLAVACGNDGQFDRLCRVLELDDLPTDPRFVTNPDRVNHRDELAKLLEEALRTDRVAGWADLLTAAGVAAGPVNDIGAAVRLAESLGLEPTVAVGPGHPEQLRHPVTWSRSPLRHPSPPPALGQHTLEIRAHLEERS